MKCILDTVQILKIPESLSIFDTVSKILPNPGIDPVCPMVDPILQDDLMVETGGEPKLEVVLRRTRYRLEQAENDNADILARSQRQVS